MQSRAGSSALIMVVAVVAIAAGAAGPVYYSAAQTSILRDSVASAPVVGRGFEVVQSGPVARGAAQLSSAVLGIDASYRRLFEAPISAVEATAFDPVDQLAIPLISRTGACEHLRISGSCPVDQGQVIISTSLATATGWRVGGTIRVAPWGSLHVTGVYTPPEPSPDYWFDRQQTYFPFEYPFIGAAKPPTSNDAMFTAPSTLASAPESAQGSMVIDQVLNQSGLRPGDVAPLQAEITNLVNDQDLQAIQAVVTSDIPQTTGGVRQAWSSLAVPVLVITLQLLVLAWLVLFLLVGDAVAARGADVALAKLRGFGWRSAIFGLSEPTLIVIAALPLGCVAGWAAASALGDILLRPGTPTGFPALALGTAAGATASGVTAVAVAAARTLRRPVLDQWRKAERTHNRTWVLDGILLTGALAGLADLALGGQIDSAHHSALSLLVPGLLGLAVAVVASRLLPLLCRVVVATRAGAAPAAFLALRHVARRPGGARTTILLATSFALATFAVSAWSVERSNYTKAAGLIVGAPVVLTVEVPPGRDLGSIVSRADPTGKRAAAVDMYSGSGSATLAVDPASWSTVASWPGGRRRLSGLLDPPTAPPAVMDGDAVRATVSVAELSPPATTLTLDVQTPTGQGVTPVQLGVLPQAGTTPVSAGLPGCPCTVRDLTFVPDPSAGSGQFTGRVTVRSLEVHDAAGWHPFDAGLSSTGSWRASGPGTAQDAVDPQPGGLAWSWTLPGIDDATATHADLPAVLPALASATTAGHTGRLTASGLDGRDLPVDVIEVAKAVPGLATGGVVVDRRFAETASGGNLAQVIQQVWVGDLDHRGAISSSLRKQGVTVLSVQSQQDAAAGLRRAGPGLAGVLFLAEAAAAAVLAAAGAILGLAVSARRRRYEMASLEVAGISMPTLVRSVVLEQVIVLAFGVAVGIAAGLAADALVLRVLPEFTLNTTAPVPATVLSYVPPAGLLTVVLLCAACSVIAVAVVAGVLLARGTRLSQLREGMA